MSRNLERTESVELLSRRRLVSLAFLVLVAAVACQPAGAPPSIGSMSPTFAGTESVGSLRPASVAAPSAASSESAASSAGSLPLTSAPPEVVLDAYLKALSANDCSTAQRLVTRTFVKGNGELCGDTQVTSYRIDPEPARPSPDDAEFATELTTTGTADRSIEAGTMTWFYELKRQPDASWRIVGGGSGP